MYDDKDRLLFIDTVGEVSDRFCVDVFAFVLMSNHYHILLRTNQANPSKAMQWLGVTYTRRFNTRHGRSGHLFQWDVSRVLWWGWDSKKDYKWSSYPIYAYGRIGPEWLKTDLILSFFSSKDDHKDYREKVQRYAGQEARLWEDLRHGLIMGTQKFVYF